MKQLLICAFALAALTACGNQKPEEQATAGVQQEVVSAPDSLVQEPASDTTTTEVEKSAIEIDRILDGI